MRKLKSLLCGFLAILVLVGSISVYAGDTYTDGTSATVEVSDATENDLVATCATDYVYQNESIYNGGSASNSFSFRLTSSYPYGKVWVSNTGSSSCNISFCYNSKTAEPYNTFSLAAGSNKVYWISANSQTGRHYCNLATSDGSSLNGLISIRRGTTKAEMS